MAAIVLVAFGEPVGQGWSQIGDLAIALVLSAAIGLERELRQRATGLRTNTLVGFAAALIVLVSKYGFTDVLGPRIILDPSRVAAQIVSGIGFIGGGLIFVRRDAVKGLTTAAVVWLTAGVGMAAGAGLWVLALAVTVGHFLVIFGLAPLVARLPRSKYAQSRVRLTYTDGHGVLRRALAVCTAAGFSIGELSIDHRFNEGNPALAAVWLRVQGTGSVTDLTAELGEVQGILTVSGDDANDAPD